MNPLERPVCFRCRDPAVNCTCDLKSGKELLIPLVYRSEPSTREEGLNLWATYLERHPATHDIDAPRFVADFKQKGLPQEADNFRSMVLDYAAADFPPMGSVNIPDKNKAATDVLSLFLCGRWIKMSHFEVTVVHNALGALYRPELRKLTPTLQLIWDALEIMLGFLTRISTAKSYCLETYRPIYQNSFKHKVYSLVQPPAKASYSGLSLSAYESLINVLMKDEMMEASVVATTCIQANVSIEEVLTWKYCERQGGDEQNRWSVIKQSESRVGAKRDVILLRLPNVLLCPVGLMALMTVTHSHCNGHDFLERARSGQASKAYLVAHPDSPIKPMTPNSIKKQLVKALAKISIKVQPYEVQSLLDATHTNCAVKAYNLKKGRKCEVCMHPASLKCGKCREVSYCSKECQSKDWKAGHKITCGV